MSRGAPSRIAAGEPAHVLHTAVRRLADLGSHAAAPLGWRRENDKHSELVNQIWYRVLFLISLTYHIPYTVYLTVSWIPAANKV